VNTALLESVWVCGGRPPTLEKYEGIVSLQPLHVHSSGFPILPARGS
jgi:hypothetical protein